MALSCCSLYQLDEALNETAEGWDAHEHLLEEQYSYESGGDAQQHINNVVVAGIDGRPPNAHHDECKQANVYFFFRSNFCLRTKREISELYSRFIFKAIKLKRYSLIDFKSNNGKD